jgi:uncharacterized protein YpmB
MADAALDDGTSCQRIRGTDFSGQQITIWVGAEDRLIRAIDAHSEASGHVWRTIYRPRANVAVLPETLSFP